MTGFGIGVGDELFEKDGDWGDCCGWGDGVGKSVDLFGNNDMPVIFGITSCGEALPFIGVGDEADEFVALLF